MRSLPAVAIAIALLAIAWVADRLLVEAVQDYGMVDGTEGTREGLLVIDRVGRVLVLAGIGVLTAIVSRGGLSFAAAIALAVAGGFITALPVLGFGLGIDALAEWARATYVQAQFVVWAAGGLLLVGATAVVTSERFDPGPPAPLVRLGVAAVLLLVALPLDAAVSSTFLEASMRTGPILVATLVDLAARLVVLGGLVALFWLTLRARRRRSVGAVMAVGGFVVFVGLAIIGLVGTGDPGSALADVPIVPYVTRWAAGGVMLIGLWELFAAAPSGQPARPSAAAAPAT